MGKHDIGSHTHQLDVGHDQDHGHKHGLVKRAHLFGTSVSGIFVSIGLICHWFGAPEWAEVLAFTVSIVAAGWFVAPKAWRAALKLTPDMNLLMCIAVVGAVCIKAWDEAAAVVFLFSVAELLESYSLSRSRLAIRALMGIAPDTALVKRGGIVSEVAVTAVKIGETIQVIPGARVPLDGVVTRGASSVNQAPITGESMPVKKHSGSDVFAGSINESDSIEVRVTKLVSHSTLARIIHLVEEAQEKKAPAQRFVDIFARYYTPAVIALAMFITLVPPLLFAEPWGIWFYRALVTLVIACPCALVISTPVSVVSALTAAARSGVLIKGGVVLESLGKLRALAMDKTGTITEGRPKVTEVVNLNNTPSADLLRVAAALESHSEHPLGKAILEYARDENIVFEQSETFRSLPGKGAEGLIGGHDYFVGNHKLVEELAVCSPQVEERIDEIERRSQTAVIIGHRPHGDCRGEVLGIISIGDRVRPSAALAIQGLRSSGIERIVMLTGDNRATAETIAQVVGIDEVEAELMPEEKVRCLYELKQRYEHVGMVGDGINDAPALAAASVGVAMGVAGTDAALETADVALMTDDLSKLSEVIALARRTARIIRFNIAFAVLIKVSFLALAATGKATMWMAVAADTGATIVVIANGLRLLQSRRESIRNKTMINSLSDSSSKRAWQ